MNKEPLISVIVPIYNVEQYLERCVNSITSQTYKNLEIILVDDGSPDNCPAICDNLAKLDNRIKVIHKKNNGVSAARNDGLKQASGDFIAFVDSDDYLAENMYETLLKKQLENNYDLVFCKYFTVENETVTPFNETELESLCKTCDLTYFFNRTSDTYFKNNKINISNYVMCNIWRVLFKKQVLTNIEFNTNTIYMEDLEFMCKVLKSGDKSLGFVDDFLYYYLKRPNSAGNTKSEKMKNNCLNLISSLESELTKPALKHLVDAFKFFCYSECVISKIVYGANIDLNDIKDWANINNYKSLKTISYGFKTKLKFLLIQHKLYFLLKLLYQLK